MKGSALWEIENRQSTIENDKASGRTPDSVRFRHLSRRTAATAGLVRYRTAPLRQDCALADDSPPALLPVGRSPSRRHRWRRWQVLTLPVRPWLDAETPSGNTFCCSCRGHSAPFLTHTRTPGLLFHRATLCRELDDTESREVPLTISRPQATEHLLACIVLLRLNPNREFNQ
jgi:hypothetical protein